MRSNRRISARLDEVLEWKASIAREVAQLPLKEAIREIHRQGDEAIVSFGDIRKAPPRKASSS